MPECHREWQQDSSLVCSFSHLVGQHWKQMRKLVKEIGIGKSSSSPKFIVVEHKNLHQSTDACYYKHSKIMITSWD